MLSTMIEELLVYTSFMSLFIMVGAAGIIMLYITNTVLSLFNIRGWIAQLLFNVMVWYILFQFLIEEMRGNCNNLWRRLNVNKDIFEVFICSRPYWELLIEKLGLLDFCYKLNKVVVYLKFVFSM